MISSLLFHSQVILNNVVDHLNNRSSHIKPGGGGPYGQIFKVSPSEAGGSKISDPDFYVPFVAKEDGIDNKHTSRKDSLLDFVIRYLT